MLQASPNASDIIDADKGKGLELSILAIDLLTQVRLVTSSTYDLVSGSWLERTNSTAAHYVASHYQ